MKYSSLEDTIREFRVLVYLMYVVATLFITAYLLSSFHKHEAQPIFYLFPGLMFLIISHYFATQYFTKDHAYRLTTLTCYTTFLMIVAIAVIF